MVQKSFSMTKHVLLLVPLVVVLSLWPSHRGSTICKALASAETSLYSDLETVEIAEGYIVSDIIRSSQDSFGKGKASK